MINLNEPKSYHKSYHKHYDMHYVLPPSTG